LNCYSSLHDTHAVILIYHTYDHECLQFELI